ncbi:MAG: AAA family ATPase [Bifidobacterium asteroides]
MRTIAVVGQKGGTGKTTTALAIASAAAEAGQAVALIDLDPQTNAANWKDRRDADNPAVVATPVGRIRQTLEIARNGGADLAVIDSPGRSDSLAVAAARAAHLVLVPVGAQIFELETLPAVRDLIRLAGDPLACLILNQVHPFATKQADGAKAMAEELSGIRACPIHLCVRDIYKTAPAAGKTPIESEPDGRAASEIRELYKFISALLHKSESSHA